MVVGAIHQDYIRRSPQPPSLQLQAREDPDRVSGRPLCRSQSPFHSATDVMLSRQNVSGPSSLLPAASTYRGVALFRAG